MFDFTVPLFIIICSTTGMSHFKVMIHPVALYWIQSITVKHSNYNICLQCYVLCFNEPSVGIIHSTGMCRMQRCLAVLRSFLRSTLLCTYPSIPTILPSSLTSSCHLFLGLTLNLVVTKFIYNMFIGPCIILIVE